MPSRLIREAQQPARERRRARAAHPRRTAAAVANSKNKRTRSDRGTPQRQNEWICPSRGRPRALPAARQVRPPGCCDLTGSGVYSLEEEGTGVVHRLPGAKVKRDDAGAATTPTVVRLITQDENELGEDGEALF